MLSNNSRIHLPPNTHASIEAGYSAQLNVLKSAFESNKSAVYEYPITSGGALPAFLKPLSRGLIYLNPKDPEGHPIIDYRTFTNPVDVDIAVAGLKMQRKVYTMPSAQRLGPEEFVPGTAVQTDAEWAEWVRDNVQPSFFHPVGTAALMARELGGVVGPDLVVHGLKGLRVVDASVMPLIPGTHTSSTVYAVAEKVSPLSCFVLCAGDGPFVEMY